MKADLNNPVIVHKSLTLEQSELKEQKRKNQIFKMLLIQFKRTHQKSDSVLRYENYALYQKM